MRKDAKKKTTENEETQSFCHIFIIGGILIGGGGWAPCLPSAGYVYDCNFNAICDIKILCAVFAVWRCGHVKATLLVLFCMIMLNMRYYR